VAAFDGKNIGNFSKFDTKAFFLKELQGKVEFFSKGCKKFSLREKLSHFKLRAKLNASSSAIFFTLPPPLGDLGTPLITQQTGGRDYRILYYLCDHFYYTPPIFGPSRGPWRYHHLA
jgi:hypothetical protein